MPLLTKKIIKQLEGYSKDNKPIYASDITTLTGGKIRKIKKSSKKSDNKQLLRFFKNKKKMKPSDVLQELKQLILVGGKVYKDIEDDYDYDTFFKGYIGGQLEDLELKEYEGSQMEDSELKDIEDDYEYDNYYNEYEGGRFKIY